MAVAPFPITGNINARAPDFTVIKIDYPDSGKPIGLPVFATGFRFFLSLQHRTAESLPFVFTASHVPIFLSVHISVDACYEPVCLIVPVTQ